MWLNAQASVIVFNVTDKLGQTATHIRDTAMMVLDAQHHRVQEMEQPIATHPTALGERQIVHALSCSCSLHAWIAASAVSLLNCSCYYLTYPATSI